jgi:hypothetical protein
VVAGWHSVVFIPRLIHTRAAEREDWPAAVA